MSRIFARLVFVPTYAWTIWLGRILRRREWWNHVESNVILGARPFRRDVPKLCELGVRGIVNLCQEYPGPVDLYASHHLEQLWLPTIDFQPPSLEHVIQGVEFIQGMVETGRGVYVHCKAGRARSATIVLCWMVKYRGMTPEQSQARLLECRPHTSPKLYKRDVVSEYVARINDSVIDY